MTADDEDTDWTGRVQVFCGAGKGKTTAALGAALRAAGAGLKVFIAQFAKRGEFSEVRALERVAGRILVRQYGLGDFILGEPSERDVAAARRGLQEASAVLAGGEYRLVVLDEAGEAVRLGLLLAEELIDAIEGRGTEVEVIVTGRHAPEELIERADLVTEMREVKHYWRQGLAAREGIEK